MIILIIDEQEDAFFRECRVCEDEIPDPYLEEEEEDGQEVVCSTCDAHFRWQAYQKRLVEGHRREQEVGEAICECGFNLANCHAATCQPDPPKRGRRPQMKLFR